MINYLLADGYVQFKAGSLTYIAYPDAVTITHDLEGDYYYLMYLGNENVDISVDLSKDDALRISDHLGVSLDTA